MIEIYEKWKNKDTYLVIYWIKNDIFNERRYFNPINKARLLKMDKKRFLNYLRITLRTLDKIDYSQVRVTVVKNFLRQ